MKISHIQWLLPKISVWKSETLIHIPCVGGLPNFLIILFQGEQFQPHSVAWLFFLDRKLYKSVLLHQQFHRKQKLNPTNSSSFDQISKGPSLNRSPYNWYHLANMECQIVVMETTKLCTHTAILAAIVD